MKTINNSAQPVKATAEKSNAAETQYDAQNRYAILKETMGAPLALFCTCAVMDVNCVEGLEPETWNDYVRMYGSGCFADGVTDVKQLLGESNDQYQNWKEVWGIGSKKNPYDTDDYRRLDKLFDTYSARLQSAGGYDEQQEDTLRSACKMRLLADKALASGTKDGVDMNTKLNKTIQEILSSENLRKKDAKPIETAKVDGIVDALSKKYGVSMSLSYEQAIKICADWMKNQHYGMTCDAAEHVIMAIINCTRENSDLPPLTEIPKEAKFSKELSTQFETNPDPTEVDVYEYLGLTREEDYDKYRYLEE